MHIVERGSGAPLVFIPTLHGRWEYVRAAVDALAASFRVITFPLCGEPSSKMPFDPQLGIDNYTVQVETALDRAGIRRATICGVSFGGLVALRFAATHAGRVASLVVASAPGPGWHMRRRHEMYARAPWMFAPVFFAETPFRVRAELNAAFDDRGARWRFSRTMLWTLLRTPASASRMAHRARLITSFDVLADCTRIVAPTLVISGELGLDHVVRADGSQEYATLIAGAQAATLERTGHFGSITRPDAFAALVRRFVDGTRDAAA